MKHLDFMASDHSYFKKRKRSAYRIRRTLPGEIQDGLKGELSGPGGADPAQFRAEVEAELARTTHVVVHQIAPGVRMRKFFTLPDIPGHKWTEEDARCLFEYGWLPFPFNAMRRPEPARAPVVPMREDKR